MSDRDSDRRRDGRHTSERVRLGQVAVWSAVVTLVVVGIVFTLLWGVLSALGSPFGLAPVLLVWAGVLVVAGAAVSARALGLLGGG